MIAIIPGCVLFSGGDIVAAPLPLVIERVPTRKAWRIRPAFAKFRSVDTPPCRPAFPPPPIMLYVYIFLAGMIPLAGIFIVRVLRGEFDRPAPTPTPDEPAPRPVETEIPRATRDDVERVLRRDFAPEQRDTVIALLEEYGSQEPNRIALAILKLSGGDVEKVLDYVVLANEDFRDVLVSAEYHRANLFGWNTTTPEEKAAYERAQAEDLREYQEWLHRE